MSEYRDYGRLSNGTEVNTPIDTTHYTQVYTATHDGAGNRLPFMNRSFISFTYGGKNIEDFNLVETIENNEIQRNAYAEFSDNVSTSTTYDGQIYWSTHYDTNTLELSLATDEREEK